MSELWDQLVQQPVAEPPSLWPGGDRAPLRITVGGPTMKDGAQASSGSSLDPFNPPQVEYVGRPIVEGLAKIFSGPSWLQRATEQSAKDQAAFQAGGVPGLMADTTGGQELAGGFGGTTTGKLAPALMAEVPAAAPAFYSALMRSIEGAKLNKASPEQWLGYLRNQPGVKAEEIDRVLGNLPKEGMFTKPDMQAHAAENAVTLGEVNKGVPNEPRLGESAIDASWRKDENPTKYSQWQLPGGENYREKLLTLPTNKVTPSPAEIENLAKTRYEGYHRKENDPPWERIAPDVQRLYREQANEKIIAAANPAAFRSSHWDEPNVLAHVRMNDRAVPGVGKSLHLEEIQSDWHQKGRTQGYQKEPTDQEVLDFTKKYVNDFQRDPTAWDSMPPDAQAMRLEGGRQQLQQQGIPDAPFKTTWPDVALKRSIREAAEKGYDAVSWTPGEAQAARYDLSKHISDVELHGAGDNLRLSAFDKNGRNVINMQHTTRQDLADHIGKEAAEKLLAQAEPDLQKNPYAARRLANADLKVGGEGMKAFYDKMLVDKANALGKKHGARVEQQNIETDKIVAGANAGKRVSEPVHVLRITPQLRDAAMKGFPLFSALFGGAATAPSLWPQEGRQ